VTVGCPGVNKRTIVSTLARSLLDRLYGVGQLFAIERSVVNVLLQVQERFDEASLTAARLAQAMTIGGFDRLVRARRGISQALPAAVSPDQKLIPRLVSHQADLVDRQYALIERLLGLHREFAQRLFDVLGAHESHGVVGETTQAPANVISLHAPRKLR
jgi:hypothetical protein